MISESNDPKPKAAWREVSFLQKERTYVPDLGASPIDIGALTTGEILEEKYVPWITQMNGTADPMD